MIVDENFRSWRERDRFAPCHSSIAFVGGRLELGRGAVLARMARAGESPLEFEGGEERVLALLALAYERPVQPYALYKMQRAAEIWMNGDACLAHVHLAHGGLSALESPEHAAYRLFLAEGVLAAGYSPRQLVKALDLDAPPLDKVFHPDEPRVPKGSGRESGWWTAGDATVDPASFLSGDYKVVHDQPKDAVPVRRSDGSAVSDPSSPTGALMAPPRADYLQIYAAGRANANEFFPQKELSVNQAVGHGGTYDFQRDRATMTFDRAYTNASNYSVGVYMAGAGYSEEATLTIAETFAHLFSSNAGAPAQIEWIRRGWAHAHNQYWK